MKKLISPLSFPECSITNLVSQIIFTKIFFFLDIFVLKMEINPNVETLEGNVTSEDEVWGMPKYEQNDLSNLANLTVDEYLAVVTISFNQLFRMYRIGTEIFFAFKNPFSVIQRQYSQNKCLSKRDGHSCVAK